MRTSTPAFHDGATLAAAATLCVAFALAPHATRAQAVDVAQDTSHEKAAEPAPQPPDTTTRFDGDWTIRIDCPAGADPSGSRAYAFDFPASVLDGKLFGSRGAQGSEGSLQVDGVIRSDGRAHLQAHGRTAAPDDVEKHPPPGTAYSYDIEARFDDTRGRGRRVQDRPCEFTFTRR